MNNERSELSKLAPTSDIAFHDQPAGALFVGTHGFPGRKAYWYSLLKKQEHTVDARHHNMLVFAFDHEETATDDASELGFLMGELELANQFCWHIHPV